MLQPPDYLRCLAGSVAARLRGDVDVDLLLVNDAECNPDDLAAVAVSCGAALVKWCGVDDLEGLDECSAMLFSAVLAAARGEPDLAALLVAEADLEGDVVAGTVDVLCRLVVASSAVLGVSELELSQQICETAVFVS